MVEAFAVQNCISHCISQTNAPKNDVPVKNSAGGVGIPRVWLRVWTRGFITRLRAGGSECVRQLPQDLVPRHDGWSGPLRRRSARQAELPLHRPSTTAQILAALPHQLSCRLDSQELNKTFTTVNCLRVLHAMFANGAIVTGGRRCSGSRSANRGEPFQEGTQVG